MQPNGPTCVGCVYGAARCAAMGLPPSEGFLKAQGEMRSGVLIVTDSAADAHSTAPEKALMGKGGFWLAKAFSRKQWKLTTDFAVTAALHCAPSVPLRSKGKVNQASNLTVEALSTCASNLDSDIAMYRPKAIITFGETAFERVTGKSLRDFKGGIMAVRGYVWRDVTDTYWVVPTFHPTWLVEGQHANTAVMLMDMEKARRIAAEGYAYALPELVMDPSLQVWESYVDEVCHCLEVDAYSVLAFDIETPYKRGRGADDEVDPADDISYNIDRISFAIDDTKGVSVVWAMPYLLGVARIFNAMLKHKRLGCAWNSNYDVPRIERALNITIPVEQDRDSMDAFHVLFNNLKKKLEFATTLLPSCYGIPAWKHLNTSDAGRYSALDAVVLWRNDSDIQRLLADTGQLEVYNLVCRDIDPVLAHMTSKGVLVDQVARAELIAELQQKMAVLTTKMQSVVPGALKPVKVWQTLKAAEKGLTLLKGNKEVDTDAVLRVVSGTKKVSRCTSCGETQVTASHTKRKTMKQLKKAVTCVA